jgi:hypothetical protein
MKCPWLVVASVVSLCLVARVARGAPPFSSSPTEDALRDGELDLEDAASQAALPRRGTILGAPRSSTWITLGGFSRELAADRRELGGFVVLGLPFDRFAGGSRSTTDLGLVRTSSVTPTPAPASAAVPPASAERDLDLALTPRLARACVEAAWRAGGFAGDESALDAIISRAHLSAALPEARIRAVRYDDATLSLDGGTDTSRLRDWAGANLGLEARLTWRLDRLLYVDDEPAFERIRLEHRDARGRIATKVLEALFHWQRAMLDLRTLPPTQIGTRDEADVLLRVMEAEAALDVLTDGWFATHKSPRVMAVERAAARRDPARAGNAGNAGNL